MKSIAFLDWSLEVECPNCKLDVDLVQYDADALREYGAKLVERIADCFRHSTRDHILLLAGEIRKGEF